MCSQLVMEYQILNLLSVRDAVRLLLERFSAMAKPAPMLFRQRITKLP